MERNRDDGVFDSEDHQQVLEERRLRRLREMEIRNQIDRDFEFHPATITTGPTHERVRHTMKQATIEVLKDCGVLGTEQSLPSRELSLFKTAMEEAMFWANAHVARNLSQEENK